MGDRAVSRHRAHRQRLHADSRRAGGSPSAPARAGIGFAFDKSLHLGYRAGMAKAKRWALTVPIDGFTLPDLAEVAREAERPGLRRRVVVRDRRDGLLRPAGRGRARHRHARRHRHRQRLHARAGHARLRRLWAWPRRRPGGFCLGLGSGFSRRWWNCGTACPSADRPRACANSVQVLRAALAGERVVFRGQALTVDGVRLRPSPARRCRSTWRRCARYAARGRRGRRRGPPELAGRRGRPARGGRRAGGDGRSWPRLRRHRGHARLLRER